MMTMEARVEKPRETIGYQQTVFNFDNNEIEGEINNNVNHEHINIYDLGQWDNIHNNL